ncbi:MAG TPA: DUF1294 domain-containing protein [Fimbriimonas sp.]
MYLNVGPCIRGAGFLFLLAVAALVVFGGLPALVLAYLLGVSLLTFFSYGLDKLRSKGRSRRIPEAHLHALSLLGGWPGAALGQQAFRHKTTKGSFQRRFLLTVIIHLAVVAAALCQWVFMR